MESIIPEFVYGVSITKDDKYFIRTTQVELDKKVDIIKGVIIHYSGFHSEFEKTSVLFNKKASFERDDSIKVVIDAFLVLEKNAQKAIDDRESENQLVSN